jgi:GNAT superfamily N-acetyltransferase
MSSPVVQQHPCQLARRQPLAARGPEAALPRPWALGLLALHSTPSLTYPTGLLRITALVVAEDARGDGIGRALVAFAIETARQAGCEAVELTTGTARTEAHAFYRKLGFDMSSLRFVMKIAPRWRP